MPAPVPDAEPERTVDSLPVLELADALRTEEDLHLPAAELRLTVTDASPPMVVRCPHDASQ